MLIVRYCTPGVVAQIESYEGDLSARGWASLLLAHSLATYRDPLGAMFWLSRNMLSGSYSSFTATSRS